MKKSRVKVALIIFFLIAFYFFYSDFANAYVDYTITDLGTLGGSQSYAWGINNLGQVVGYSATTDNKFHAFLWEKDKGMIDLGLLGGSYSYAYGINNSGNIAGGSNTNTVINDYNALLWEEKTNKVNLGTEEIRSSAYGINNSGQVAGYSATENYEKNHAFLWEEEKGMIDIGILDGDSFSIAYGINESGQVVGSSGSENSLSEAFLWEDGDNIVNLNNLIAQANKDYAWKLRSARGINDYGQIVGSGIFYNNEHAFIITPVPEPSSILLMGIGFLGLLGLTRKRKKRANT